MAINPNIPFSVLQNLPTYQSPSIDANIQTGTRLADLARLSDLKGALQSGDTQAIKSAYTQYDPTVMAKFSMGRTGIPEQKLLDQVAVTFQGVKDPVSWLSRRNEFVSQYPNLANYIPETYSPENWQNVMNLSTRTSKLVAPEEGTYQWRLDAERELGRLSNTANYFRSIGAYDRAKELQPNIQALTSKLYGTGDIDDTGDIQEPDSGIEKNWFDEQGKFIELSQKEVSDLDPSVKDKYLEDLEVFKKDKAEREDRSREWKLREAELRNAMMNTISSNESFKDYIAQKKNLRTAASDVTKGDMPANASDATAQKINGIRWQVVMSFARYIVGGATTESETDMIRAASEKDGFFNKLSQEYTGTSRIRDDSWEGLKQRVSNAIKTVNSLHDDIFNSLKTLIKDISSDFTNYISDKQIENALNAKLGRKLQLPSSGGSGKKTFDEPPQKAKELGFSSEDWFYLNEEDKKEILSM
jgi:hypothetical protein